MAITPPTWAPPAMTDTKAIDFKAFEPGIGGDDEGPLYVAHRTIYQQSISGRLRTIKWALLIGCLAIYYILPFVRWYRGPGRPDQAVLLDIAHERFYFFWIEIWPQEIYYATGLLIISAFVLFLMNAVAGRVWCGYLCPQTVWTDLFMAVERLCEGDRRERMINDSKPLDVEIFARKGLKHVLWLMIAWWTGGAWVLYFADAPTLVRELATFQAPSIAYIWIAILTFTTYALAGMMREQVCLYMCPWPRIQAALTDEWALNVTYRYDRGEPRMSVKQAVKAKAADEPAGDCIECRQCVVVCPTGVDIRDGAQLGCIQCGLCIDACNSVMTKVGRPQGLIAYDNDVNIHRRAKGEDEVYRVVRPRTVLYALLIVAIATTMIVTLNQRTFTSLASTHDRDDLYVRLSNGGIRNGYTIRVANKRPQARLFLVAVEGIPLATANAIGASGTMGDWPVIDVGADQTREFRLLVTVPPGAKLEASTPIRLRVTEVGTGESASVVEHFVAPGNS